MTGITTAGFATMSVLKRAAASGNNLVIVHEPTFYNHLDKLDRYGDDPVVSAKRKFVEDNGLVVFRFHDHLHRHEPDGICFGMEKEIDWQANRVAGEDHVYELKETTVAALAASLKQKLGGRVVRCVGDPAMKVRRVALVVGAPGSRRQVEALRSDGVDLLLAGESPEWETTEYVRDAVELGQKKALIMLGHNNSEEAGMKYCAEWLQSFLPDLPIEFVASGDPFWAAR